MFRIAAFVALLNSACVPAAGPPTTAGVPASEPPGACIYKVTVTSESVIVLYNPSPCPREIKGWLRVEVKLPKDICGVDIGSEFKPEIVVNPVPCSPPVVPLTPDRIGMRF